MSSWMSERDDVMRRFSIELSHVTKDGSKKRQAGEKPPWYQDRSHEAAIFSHLTKWKRGERIDRDSGVHPLIHAAWRCLAIACSENGNNPDAEGSLGAPKRESHNIVELARRVDYDPEYYTHQPKDDEMRWMAIDLDDTLAEGVWPESEGIGQPIWENVEKLHDLNVAGYKIIIHTARPWGHYRRIEAWLMDFGIPFKAIVCGKLQVVSYIDDKAINEKETSWLPSAKHS